VLPDDKQASLGDDKQFRYEMTNNFAARSQRSICDTASHTASQPDEITRTTTTFE
jgi:hypothetical protein